MNKTPLEVLLFESGLKIKDFADKVGIKEVTFKKQLYNKVKHYHYAIKYACILKQNFKYNNNNVILEVKF